MSIEFSAANQLVRAILSGVNTDAFTVTAQIYQVSDLNAFGPIFAVFDNGTYSERGLYFKADGTTVVAAESDNSASSADIGAITAAAWNGVALVGKVSSGTQLRGFLNSNTPQQVARATMAASNIILGTDFYVNSAIRMAQLRIWNVALSDAEVTAELASDTPVKTANLLGHATLAGADVAAAMATWVQVNATAWPYFTNDPSYPPTISASDPSRATGPLLSGASVLQIA